MWGLHALLAETREQDLRRQTRERYLAQQAVARRRRLMWRPGALRSARSTDAERS